MNERPLLMIPGPIEVSDAVVEAAAGPPPSHLAADLVADFAAALRDMRHVWLAGPDAQPFVVAGSGTLAMEMAATNLVDPGDVAVVVSTGWFSDRMAEMLRRRGAQVTEVRAPVGEVPPLERVAEAARGARALFATHVDTSTGVRVDPQALAAVAAEHGALSVFDGVCATAAERFEMAAWGADVYLSASQKAIGLPAGLALVVAGPRALAARQTLRTPPPLSLDFEQWLPVMRGYEAGTPTYFATPATTLVRPLRVALAEILAGAEPAAAMAARFALHARAAAGFRAAWEVLGLRLVPRTADVAAHTLSALYLPDGVDATLPGAIRERGVVVAGGLHPEIRARSFRVGHMGHVLNRPEALARTVAAVGGALADRGLQVDVEAAVAAASALWEAPLQGTTVGGRGSAEAP